MTPEQAEAAARALGTGTLALCVDEIARHPRSFISSFRRALLLEAARRLTHRSTHTTQEEAP